PRLRAPATSAPVIAPETAAAYPALAADIATADQVIGAAFTECDTRALREQNRYRRQQVLLIFGAGLAAGLGGVQAVFPGQRWPGSFASTTSGRSTRRAAGSTRRRTGRPSRYATRCWYWQRSPASPASSRRVPAGPCAAWSRRYWLRWPARSPDSRR